MRTGTGFLVLGLVVVGIGCGKKAPPLPPLVRLPAAPTDLSAVRRGSTVALRFTIPRANTDGSTPADLSRVDVYAVTGASTLTSDEIIKRGKRVDSIRVNPPADPDEPETPSPEKAPKPDAGLNQGAVARVSESIVGGVGTGDSDIRSYVAVGVNDRGRRGAISSASVSLAVAPPAPPRPSVSYDEKRIAVTWTSPSVDSGKTLTFRVYAAGEPPLPLTDMPLDAPRFEDTRIEWGAERCFAVRSVETTDGLAVESEASPPACVSLTDTFPPAAPTGLQTVSVEGVVDLFWESNAEADIAGYHVFRAVAPETQLVPVTPSPLRTPGFRDTAQRNVRVSYAVQAVDTAGNASALSVRIEETTR